MEFLNVFKEQQPLHSSPHTILYRPSHHIQPSPSSYSSFHHHSNQNHNIHPSSLQDSSLVYRPSMTSNLDYSNMILNSHNKPLQIDPAERAPHHVMHYLQQGLEHINSNLSSLTEYVQSGAQSSNLTDSMDMSYALQQRRFQPPPEDYTTVVSVNVTNVLMSNKTELATQLDESVFSLMTVRNAMIIFFYSLIIVVSLTGNLLVCKVAFGTREMRTTTNLLIASLACSDIVMTVFNIPFNVVRMLPISWPFGELICVLVPLIQTSCVYVSTFTMTLIALHRLWTVRSKKITIGKRSGCKVALTVLAIWLIALTLSLPHAAFNRVRSKVFMGRVLTRCMVQLPSVSFNFRLLLTVFVLITQYIVPLSITLVVYVKIGRVIARQGQLICKLSDEKKRRQSEAKRRRIFMLALAVATFATCWAPINLYLFLVDTKVLKLQTVTFIMCHWFAMSSVCYNPIIYCWFNEKFRNGAKRTIRSILNLAYFPLSEKQTTTAYTAHSILSTSV